MVRLKDKRPKDGQIVKLGEHRFTVVERKINKCDGCEACDMRPPYAYGYCGEVHRLFSTETNIRFLAGCKNRIFKLIPEP